MNRKASAALSLGLVVATTTGAAMAATTTGAAMAEDIVVKGPVSDIFATRTRWRRS